MKKLLLFALIIALFDGCNLVPKPGNLELTVSYFYNNFQGYKPDVGATACLFEKKYNDSLNMDSINLVSSRAGVFYNKYIKDKFYDPKKMLKGEADVTGKISFKDVPAGEYFLLVTSKGRYVFSQKTVTIEPIKTLVLVKNFEYFHDMDPKGESWD